MYKVLKFLQRINELGEGDDSKNIQSDFDKWYLSFWENVYLFFKTNENKFKERKLQIEKNFNDKLDYEIKLIEQSEFSKLKQENEIYNDDYEYFLKRYQSSSKVQIENIMELRKSKKNGSTLKIVYKNTSGLKYKVADNIGVYPNNSESSVVTIAEKLKFDLNKIISVKKLKKDIKCKINFPDCMKVKDILINVIDLSCHIK